MSLLSCLDLSICGINTCREIIWYKRIRERMEHKMKKWSIVFLTGIVSMGMFSGCGKVAAQKQVDGLEAINSTENATETTGKVSLTLWGAKEDKELLTQIVDNFKQEYAGQADFDITIGEQSESECRDVLLGNVEEAADVFTFADDQLMALAASGVLKPVENADAVKSANAEGAVTAASIGDDLYAYPLTADNGYFMFYDKSVFSDEDVKTLDGMLNAATAAGKKVAMDWSSGWYLYSFFGNTGMELGLNEDGISNHCDWNSTDNKIKGVDVAQAMLAISANPGFINTNDEGFTAGAKDGSIAAGISGVWSATELQKAWGKNLGAAKLPTYTCGDAQVQMASFAGYKLVGVNSYSKHTDWATKLAEWITSEENQKLRFEMRGQGPANTNAASADEVKKSPAIQALIAQSEFASLQRIGNNYWSPIAEFGASMAQGNPSGKDLQEQLDTMVEGITASNAQ